MAMRATSIIAASAFDDYHPVAVASVAGGLKGFVSLAGRHFRDLREELLRPQHIDSSYCPLCLAQYADSESGCPDCDDLP